MRSGVVTHLAHIMLETQPILQPDAYKLTWHPMWKLPHQQLKHNSALTFNTNIFLKKKKKHLTLIKLLKIDNP
jgi:hypothetical protein